MKKKNEEKNHQGGDERGERRSSIVLSLSFSFSSSSSSSSSSSLVFIIDYYCKGYLHTHGMLNDVYVSSCK